MHVSRVRARFTQCINVLARYARVCRHSSVGEGAICIVSPDECSRPHSLGYMCAVQCVYVTSGRFRRLTGALIQGLCVCPSHVLTYAVCYLFLEKVGILLVHHVLMCISRRFVQFHSTGARVQATRGSCIVSLACLLCMCVPGVWSVLSRY